MKQISLTIISAVLAVAVVAGAINPHRAAAAEPVVLLAGVETFDLVALQTYPVQVRVAVYGWMSDSCTSIRNFTQIREGQTIYLKIYTTRPADAMCAQAIKRFRRTFPLETAGLPPGDYTVDVSGKRKHFTLP